MMMHWVLVPFFLAAWPQPWQDAAGQTPQPQAQAQDAQSEAGEGQEQPTTDELTPGVGPMRIELLRLQERRFKFFVVPVGAEATLPESDLGLFVRLAGRRTKHVHRIGRLIVTEVTDDTGQALSPMDQPTAEQEGWTRVVAGPEKLTGQGLTLEARLKAPGRAATKLAKVRGWARVIYAKDSEEITINNPLQYEGKLIEHPRLRELGIEIKVLPRGSVPNVPNDDSHLVLQFLNHMEWLRAIDVQDAWMQNMRQRVNAVSTAEGETCYVYQLVNGRLSEETSLLIQAFPEVEDVRFPVELDNIELP